MEQWFKPTVYILSNFARTVFYIGVTSNLYMRMLMHRAGKGSQFAARYRLTYLVYYEECDSMAQAIEREKQLKGWHRQWKIDLIRSVNPEMKDLSDLCFDRFRVLTQLQGAY